MTFYLYFFFRIREWGSSGAGPPASNSTHQSRSTLRRSKSVGAGIHNLEEEMKNEELNKSRPCILAEEMPAPDTVKNVRTVFEQMFSKNIVPDSSAGPVPLGTPNGKIMNGNVNGAPTCAPKSLTCIKSNPTSKIFRSESMRDGGSRFGKPVISKTNSVDVNLGSPTSNGTRPFEFKRRGSKPTVLEQKLLAATAEVSNNKFLNEVDEEERMGSLSSTVTSADDTEDLKIISPDVLSRIRSLGTTTTYFGGEIVAKTVKNRKLAVTPKPKKNLEDDYEPEFVSDEIYYSARPNQEKVGSRPPRTDFRPFQVPLETIYSGRHQSMSDSTPRIISVLPKSPSNSPTKSNSPVGSIIEGRNSPEGCESHGDHQANPEWINEKRDNDVEDTNNNNDSNKIGSKKFSEAADGVWF